jgi:hypothetical protein
MTTGFIKNEMVRKETGSFGIRDYTLNLQKEKQNINAIP